MFYYAEGYHNVGFPEVKNTPANARDTGSIPGSGRYLGEENGNPLQCFFLENPKKDGCGSLAGYSHGVTKVRQDLVAKQQQSYCTWVAKS